MSDDLNWDDLYRGTHDQDDQDDEASFVQRPCRAKFTIPIAGREVKITLFDTDDVNLTIRAEDMIEHYTMEHAPEDEE